MIESRQHEAVVYFNSNFFVDKEILAYAESHFNLLRKVDVSHEKITGTRLEEIARQAGLPLQGLLRGRALTEKGEQQAPALRDENDIIKFVQHNPAFLDTPIIVTREKAGIVKRVCDLYELTRVTKKAMF